jgi:hypothetical protein
MKKVFLFLSMIVAVGLVGCEQSSREEFQTYTNERPNCPSFGRVINDVEQVIYYKSSAIEVFYLKAPRQEVSVFLSPSDRLSIPQVVEDVPEGRMPWAYLGPAGAYVTSTRYLLFGGVERDWSCKFILKIHLSPGSQSRIIDDRH